MAIPDYQTLMRPVLAKAAESAGEVSVRDILAPLGNELGLSDEDMAQLLPSGQFPVFHNRLHWAKTYLQKSGLLESTRRGYFQITEPGRAALRQYPDRIDNRILNNYPAFQEWKARSASALDEAETVNAKSPEDQIQEAYDAIQTQLKEELIARIRELPPAFFERLIIDLLIAMGYGGGRESVGRALGRSGDGGIDGLINEDELGLDVVYVQAKRYAEGVNVGIGEIRDFVGSLAGSQASKGVFVTTSKFPATASEYASRIPQRIVLINGDRLATLMIKHGVGVRRRATIEINRLDEDYFENVG